jgi:hypothetical protein
MSSAAKSHVAHDDESDAVDPGEGQCCVRHELAESDALAGGQSGKNVLGICDNDSGGAYVVTGRHEFRM